MDLKIRAWNCSEISNYNRNSVSLIALNSKFEVIPGLSSISRRAASGQDPSIAELKRGSTSLKVLKSSLLCALVCMHVQAF